MPRTFDDHEDWQDDADDSEWMPDDDDDSESEWHEEDDDDDTIPCPHCHQSIYEGAEQCPHCGKYLSEEDAPSLAKPLWIIVGGLICLAIVLLWVWRG
jgi:uncharacterized paraquat-inducible protein A